MPPRPPYAAAGDLICETRQDYLRHLATQARAWVRGDPEDDLPGRVLRGLVVFQDMTRFGALPDPGGLLDQEYELMQDVRLITDVVDEERAARADRVTWTTGRSGRRR